MCRAGHSFLIPGVQHLVVVTEFVKLLQNPPSSGACTWVGARRVARRISSEHRRRRQRRAARDLYSQSLGRVRWARSAAGDRFSTQARGAAGFCQKERVFTPVSGVHNVLSQWSGDVVQTLCNRSVCDRSSTLCDVAWALSRKSRNRLAHLRHGNGPDSPTVADLEQAFFGGNEEPIAMADAGAPGAAASSSENPRFAPRESAGAAGSRRPTSARSGIPPGGCRDL